jgi:hypothetical protein
MSPPSSGSKNKLSRPLLAACFMPISCLAYSSILKMEATCSSRTLVDFEWAARHCIPEDRTFHNHRCETSDPTYHLLRSQPLCSLIDMFCVLEPPRGSTYSKSEGNRFPKVLVAIYRTASCHIPVNCNLNMHCHGNLRPHNAHMQKFLINRKSTYKN